MEVISHLIESDTLYYKAFSELLAIKKQTTGSRTQKCASNGSLSLFMMPGSKGLSPHELAHRWVKDLRTRPDMSIKVGRKHHDMRIAGRLWECVA